MMSARSRLRRPAPWLAVAGLAALILVVWRTRAPGEPEVRLPARVLKFPDEDYGWTLHLHEGVSEEVEWSPLPAGRTLAAIGTVAIPAETWAGLVIQPQVIGRGMERLIIPIPDLQILHDFKPNDLQYIQISSLSILGLHIRRDFKPSNFQNTERMLKRFFGGASPIELNLSAISHLTGLRHLDLYAVDITDEDLKHLRELDRLVSLVIFGPHITEDGLNRLRAALPNCTINGVKGLAKLENRRPIG